MKEYTKPLAEIESLMSKCDVAAEDDKEVALSTKDWFDQIVGN